MSSVRYIEGYDTKKFTDIFDDQGTFLYHYLNSGIPTTISNNSVITLYYLLYARYGNSHIANYDENQFIYKVLSIIFQYGPAWEKRLEIQNTIRGLTEDELLKGSKAIYNHAFNPETTPGTQTLEELEFINDQNTTNYKKSKMDAYTQLWNMLTTDVTEEFLRKFQVCFKHFVQPGALAYFPEEDDD